MKHILTSSLLALVLCCTATASAANCYADYKAKRDNPLRLHYGVVQINGACATQSAQQEIAARLQSQGWTLLNVLSVFDASGLEEKKRSAGQYFLRF